MLTVSVFPLMQLFLVVKVFLFYLSPFPVYQEPKYINNRRLILISTTTLMEIELTYNNTCCIHVFQFNLTTF